MANTLLPSSSAPGKLNLYRVPRPRSGLAIGNVAMKMGARGKGTRTKCENKPCGTIMTEGHSHSLPWTLISLQPQASFPHAFDGPHSEIEAEC